ncbi:hypothetical protein [Candidatus Thalassolituus haligoni]|uniref:hypothetical protein n=1 Tax=Candidatus Thalassolituus haligoni TaxID=3100113 RepID=UPI0035131DAC|tara:strand:- start:12308 stop:12610 length:303 start_codon:yes stop_codon:yes gene_type:complete
MINRCIMLRMLFCVSLLGAVSAFSLLDAHGNHDAFWSSQVAFSDPPALLDGDNDRYVPPAPVTLLLLTLVLMVVLLPAMVPDYRTQHRASIRVRGPPRRF